MPPRTMSSAALPLMSALMQPGQFAGAAPRFPMAFYPPDGGEGGGAQSPPPPPPPPAVQEEPKTFSLEYVRELREENKGLRLAKSNAERAAADAAAAVKKAGEDAKAEIERATAAANEGVTKAQAAANERIIRAELKAHAIKAGIVDLDALKLMDHSAVKLNDAGEVEGAEAALEAFKTAKPHFFGTPASGNGNNSTSSSAKPPPAKPATGKKASEMDDAEFQAAMKRIDAGLPPA